MLNSRSGRSCESRSLTEVVALVPARAGSKGVPRKNVRLLGGRPLLSWTIAACRRTPSIDRVILSTDSMDFAALGRDLGAEVPFLRPAEISDDQSTDYEFVTHALDHLVSEGAEPKIVVHMRPTTPFRLPALVDEAVRQFQTSAGATAMRSVHEMPESAWKSFEVDDGLLRQLGETQTNLDAANLARQAYPKTYAANGYVDVLDVAFIRDSGMLHGDRVLPFLTEVVTEVDTEHEFRLLEYQLDQNPEIASELFG